MNDDTHTIESGLLDVGDGHKIYYQRWGNKDATPTIYFHGGPGSSTSDKSKNFFDPKISQVIFFDQRGCGKSTYEDPYMQNTTDNIIADVEKLRAHLKVTTVNLFGYSWGSTLALYYAVKNHTHVAKIVIGGVYLATKEENDYLFNGGLKNFAVEAWSYYCEPIPSEQRLNCLDFYYDNIINGNGSAAKKIELLQHFSILENSLGTLDNDHRAHLLKTKEIISLDDQVGTFIGLHYFKNNGYIPEHFFADNLGKLSDKQVIIVQGNMDFACPPITAKFVADLIGDSCHLHFVPSSHKPEATLREVIRAYTWSLLN